LAARLSRQRTPATHIQGPDPPLARVGALRYHRSASSSFPQSLDAQDGRPCPHKQRPCAISQPYQRARVSIRMLLPMDCRTARGSCVAAGAGNRNSTRGSVLTDSVRSDQARTDRLSTECSCKVLMFP
jgi:hypothetical protein